MTTSRLIHWQLPSIGIGALIGFAAEKVGLSFEASVAAVLTWQLLFTLWLLRRSSQPR